MRGFRDALCADPVLRRRYAVLKRAIVAGGPADPVAFTKAKHDWISATLARLGLARSFQLVNVFNARSDERSAFSGLFKNHWLWGAVGLSLLLQAMVIYVPFLQQAFSTVSLSTGDWLVCAAVASSVLWLRELSKLVTRGLAAPRLIP